MRNGIERGGLFNADHEIVGQFAGGPTCAVGDADELGTVGLQLTNGVVKRIGRLGRFRRKEFKRKRGGVALEDVPNMHGKGLILLPLRGRESSF